MDVNAYAGDVTTASGRLRGKVAIITGGAGNIGEVITRRYLAEGATVVITGRNTDKLQAYRQRLIDEEAAEPERIAALRVDGSDMAQVRTGIADVLEQFGRIDILVNNAGSAGPKQRLPDVPIHPDDVRAPDTETVSQSVGNLLGISWNMVRGAAPHMPPGSSIINVSTIFSRTDYYGRIPYVVPKAALNALSLGLAKELGARGIRVNTVYPGPIESERIYNVFKAMDGLKGVPDGTTANEFMGIMRLSHADEHTESSSNGSTANLRKKFPTPLNVANSIVFLGSDESLAFSGHNFEVTHGMDVPLESSTTFTSRPGLRNVDAVGKAVLVCAGNQVEEAQALVNTLRSCRADVALTFRDRAALVRTRNIFQDRRYGDHSYAPPMFQYLNPLEPETTGEVLRQMYESTGGPHYAIIMPAQGVGADPQSPYPGSLVDVPDEVVARFIEEEIVGAIALASQLSRFWYGPDAPPIDFMPGAPHVLFMSNANDGQGNAYADIQRAAIEELARDWRHESALDVAKMEQEGALPTISKRSPVWAHQLIRYSNHEDENLRFSCAWATKLFNSDRHIQEINLYIPDQIAVTTGAHRLSFGWAESLIGMHSGKVALITGGSAGIGGQIGRLLALGGAQVMLAARGAEQLHQMREAIITELKDAGYANVERRIQIYPGCDVSNELELQTVVERTIDIFGRIDYLINNAGIAGAEEMVIDMPLDAWRKTLQANLNSNYSLLRKVAPLMKAQGSGYILNVSSYFGGEKSVAIPYPNRSDYAVSKAGQRAMAEAFARFMGPEVQFNALAPGPVEGDRLRGTGERPGLFNRRARLILENKRLNDLHAALIQAMRTSDEHASLLLSRLLVNDVRTLLNDQTMPAPLRKVVQRAWDESDPDGSSRTYLMNDTIATKLVNRMRNGGYLLNAPTGGDQEGGNGVSQPDLNLTLQQAPPEPFLTQRQIEREARKVRDGVLGMLHLKEMPTEIDVARATVYYLADPVVSGETFHPSGGLNFERTVTQGELFGKASPAAIARLRGTTVYIIGEHLRKYLNALIRTYLEECDVARVVMITENEEAEQAVRATFPNHSASGRLCTLASHGDIESALDKAYVDFGRPGPVVSTPFRPLPSLLSLAGPRGGDWDNVMNEADFVALVEHNLTHHFRVARKVSLVDGAQLVLVTSSTAARSTAEEFAMANFIKTTLHAFTATLGVESERIVHNVPVNQVDLTRRARTEEPRSADEEAEEMVRFINAILLVSAPQVEAKESRYRSRIYRGNAITV